MRKLSLLFVIILLAVPFFVMAQGDPHENACYAGGSLWHNGGDSCPTEWHWIVGWYLAQWENNGGWNNPDNFFPVWGDPQNVLPPRPEVETPPTPPAAGVPPKEEHKALLVGCQWITNIEGDDFFVQFGNEYVLQDPVVYSDNTCSTPSTSPNLSMLATRMVYTVFSAPASVCPAVFGAGFTGWYPDLDTYVAFCVVD